MSPTPLLPLGLYLAGGLAGLAASRRPALALRLGAAGALAAGLAGLALALRALGGGAAVAVELPWSVPGGALSLVVDPLSAVFLVPVFLLTGLCALYGVEYLGATAGGRGVGGQVFFLNLLGAAMAALVMARNGVLFLFAWEVMSLASFFLVSFEHERPPVREAGLVYLVAMHLGTAFLLGLFALLSAWTGSLRLDPGAAAGVGGGGKALLLLLACVGFGAKAGIWPLHVWLPKAHPAAPSHVSALMSAVMIKTGVYGLCRTLTLLGEPDARWGLALLGLGAVSGLMGILHALARHDLKGLLAYCSEENIGIILIGLGAGVLGSATGHPVAAALGYAGALLHVWNHSLFKGLLFLGAGSVVRATHELSLERLGGLWRRMPWTGWTFLVGAAAICGLPPFNGLVSEWLIFGALLRAGVAEPGPLALAPLAAAAALALVGGLALAAFAKAVGIGFLGEPRSESAQAARDPGPAMLFPMVLLATLCLAIGLLPVAFVSRLRWAVAVLDDAAVAGFGGATGWASPLATVGALSAALIAGVALLLLLRGWLLRGREVAVSPTWDCGYAAPGARMQYTAASFASPLAGVFRPLLRVRSRVAAPEGPFPRRGGIETTLDDTADRWLWDPLFRHARRGLAGLKDFQEGRIQRYLLMMFLALVALLGWAVVSP